MARQKFVAGNDFKFTPRAFAQNWFEKLDVQMAEEEVFPLQIHEGRMIFRQGEEEKSHVAAVSAKYPTVTDVVPSQATANTLKNLLYAQDGILTLHLSYLYLSWFAGPRDATVGDYLAKLATNDGEILNALGNITVAFGGDPNFATSNGRNFSTQFLLLNRNQFPENAISMEQRAIKNFEQAIATVENESLKKLLTQIRDDKIQIVQDLAKLRG